MQKRYPQQCETIEDPGLMGSLSIDSIEVTYITKTYQWWWSLKECCFKVGVAKRNLVNETQKSLRTIPSSRSAIHRGNLQLNEAWSTLTWYLLFLCLYYPIPGVQVCNHFTRNNHFTRKLLTTSFIANHPGSFKFYQSMYNRRGYSNIFFISLLERHDVGASPNYVLY